MLRRRLADPIDKPLELGDAELGLVAQIGLKNKGMMNVGFVVPTNKQVMFSETVRQKVKKNCCRNEQSRQRNVSVINVHCDIKVIPSRLPTTKLNTC